MSVLMFFTIGQSDGQSTKCTFTCCQTW